MKNHQPKRVQYHPEQPLPKGVKYVGHVTEWAQPFEYFVQRSKENIQNGSSRGEALGYYEEHVLWQLEKDPEFLEPLRGYDLACHCQPNESCHADILVEYLTPIEGMPKL